MIRILKLLAIILLLSTNVFAGTSTTFQPENLDFEDAIKGQTPYLWYFSKDFAKAGYLCQANNYRPAEGKTSCKLSLVTIQDTAYKRGMVQQKISAFPFRGHKFKFRAATRSIIIPDSAKAMLYLIITKIDNTYDVIELEDDPITDFNWKYREIIADIPNDAIDIAYGLELLGKGEAYIDDVSITMIQPEGTEANNKAHFLRETVKNNYLDFANIYAMTKFFSPSIEGMTTKWDDFLLNGTVVCEESKDVNDYINNMQNLFENIAPAIEISKKDISDTYKYSVPKKISKDSVLSWIHVGAYSPFETPLFGSQLRNLRHNQRIREGAVMRIIPIDKSARNKTIELSAMMKFIPRDMSGYAQIWLRVDREKGYVQSKRMSTIIRDTIDWEKQTIEVKLGDDVVALRIGLILFGEGDVYFDDIKIKDVKTGFVVKFDNHGFETEIFGKAKKEWNVPVTVKNAGYIASYSDKEVYKGAKSMHLYSNSQDMIKFPKLGDTYTYISKRGYSASFPIAVAVNKKGSYPKAKKKLKLNSETGQDIGFYPIATDRISRIAILVDAYAYIKTFSSGIKNIDNIDSLFKHYLTLSSKSMNEAEFLTLLNNFTDEFQEPNLFVWKGWSKRNYCFPFQWIITDNEKVVINQSIDTTMAASGEEVIRIDGQLVSEIIVPRKGFGIYQNVRQMAKIRHGKKDSQIKMTFRDSSGKDFERIVKRSILNKQLEETRPPIMYQMDSTTVYADITSLDDKEIKDNISVLDKFDKIIFDCRGKIRTTPHILSWFIDKNLDGGRHTFPIFSDPENKYGNNKKFGISIKGENKLKNKKLFFLVNEMSRGNTTDLLKIVQYYKLGTLVGRETVPARQETLYYHLLGEYSLSFVPGESFAPNGSQTNSENIVPDIQIKFTKENAGSYLPYIKTIIKK